jgi:beta-phosphoglucomutase family hydrolase
MLKAVIFDMDGVIIDSEPFHWKVNKKIFRDLDIRVSVEEYQNYIGVSNTDMWTDLKKKFRLPHAVDQLVAMQVGGNVEFMEQEHFEPIDGVVALIRNLEKNAVAMALASSSPHKIITMVLDKFAIKSSFSIIVSGEDFKKGKPAPDIFLKAAELLFVSPKDCVVIEDAAHGVAAAKAAGMKCVGFANGNSGNQDLGKADLIVSALNALTLENITALANAAYKE